MIVDAVVLAGGSAKGLSDKAVDNKALIEIGGRPMVDYVVEALRRTPEIERIIVVVPHEGATGEWAEKADTVVVSNGSVTENFFAGLEKAKSKGFVLAVSADIPLLTPKAVSDFLIRCRQVEAQFYYPIISREKIEKQYPSAVRTYARMNEGCFTGGNIALIEPATFLSNRELFERFYGLRKSPLKLTMLIGFIFIVKFLLHRLTVEEAQKKASDLLKAKGIAIITSYAEIGIDVDKDSDLELVSRVLARS